MTADLLRRQLQTTADTLDGINRDRAMKLLVHGAQTALHRAMVIGAEAALRELDAELSDASTVRACRSALQSAADRILSTASPIPASGAWVRERFMGGNPGGGKTQLMADATDPDDESTRMAVNR